MFALCWWKGCEHIMNNRSLELEGIFYVHFLLCFIFALSALWPICHKQQKKVVRFTGMGSHFLLQGIFPSQGLNPGLPQCRWIIYQLGHQGSPKILDWVTYPFSTGSSQPRNQTGVSCIASGFFTNWAIREAYILIRTVPKKKKKNHTKQISKSKPW